MTNTTTKEDHAISNARAWFGRGKEPPMTYEFNAIEDNAGGLHLFAFDEGECIYAAHGFEQSIGSLHESIKAIRDGADPREFDDNAEDPRGDWYDMDLARMSAPSAYKTVADQNGQYPDDMGVAARLDFAEQRQ